jgi:Flp pilus assembly protein TadD
MRRLLTLTLAVLAGPALVPAAHSAGSEPPPVVQRPQDPDYEAGMKAISGRDYQAAVDNFKRAAARDPNNADMQNHLGYSYRKSGNLDMAFKHYNEALRLDPNHRGAHEYIGETWLLVNNLPKAEEHLARLDKLCLFPCEEFTELKQAIQKYKQQHARN